MHPLNATEAAQSMIRAHGARAAQHCRHMIEKMAKRGDHQGYETWRMILDAVRSLRAAEAGTE
jgi:hypothetical protein